MSTNKCISYVAVYKYAIISKRESVRIIYGWLLKNTIASSNIGHSWGFNLR